MTRPRPWPPGRTECVGAAQDSDWRRWLQVEECNGAIRRLPGSLLVRLGDFRRKARCQASKGAGAEVRFD